MRCTGTRDTRTNCSILRLFDPRTASRNQAVKVKEKVDGGSSTQTAAPSCPGRAVEGPRNNELTELEHMLGGGSVIRQLTVLEHARGRLRPLRLEPPGEERHDRPEEHGREDDHAQRGRHHQPPVWVLYLHYLEATGKAANPPNTEHRNASDPSFNFARMMMIAQRCGRRLSVRSTSDRYVFRRCMCVSPLRCKCVWCIHVWRDTRRGGGGEAEF